MLNIPDAEHEETAPQASRLLIHKLSCSLVGQTQAVMVLPGTQAFWAYGRSDSIEKFQCHYGLNPAYRNLLEAGGLRAAGNGPDGELRIVELPEHRFFIATLFLPQFSSAPGHPHPLIMAYLRAARAFQSNRRRNGEYERASR